MSGRPRKSLKERFFNSFIPKSPDECWEWLGYKYGPLKYGRIAEGGGNSKLIGAHRVSWELHKGPIPDGLLVLHSCNNGSCVNPNHLYLGTHSDNMFYRYESGTDNKAYGSKHGQTKFDEKTALEIRKLYSSGKYSCSKLSNQFNVSKATINNIVRRITWKHI